MKKYPGITLLKAFFAFIFMAMSVNVGYLSLTGRHLLSNDNIESFAAKRGTVTETIDAVRGDIVDRNKEVIATNATSYKLIAYLDSSRMAPGNKPAYVVDKEKTAHELSKIMEMPYDKVLATLSKSSYQVEFGTYGSNLNNKQKIAIEESKLPGLELIESQKRYYPNGTFASETVGFAQKDLENELVGMQGLEKTYDKYLKGVDGSAKYQVDTRGYKMVDAKLYQKNALNGGNVTLTIDSTIQRILESSMQELNDKFDAEMMLSVVMDAKTGAILGVSNRPTYNPNLRDIQSYLNPLVSYVYEPGSTMKIFTYAAAMDAGVYNGNYKYPSGHFDIKNAKGNTVRRINDWNPSGWGTLTLDQGFMKSSNAGVGQLVTKFLKPDTLEKYLEKFGFYQKTGIELDGEEQGVKVFDRIEEQVTTAFGQASTITPVQLLQAFSAITNGGTMMKPYVVSQVTDEKGKEVYSGKPTVSGNPISKETASQMVDLMTKVVETEFGTGYPYHLDDYTMIGKTGTAQYVENGRYKSCHTCYIQSFLTAAPASDPEIIVYTMIKKPKTGDPQPRFDFVKTVTNATLKYLNVAPDKTEVKNNETVKNIELPNFVNHTIDYTKKKLSNQNVESLIIGNGQTVIDQFPKGDDKIANSEIVMLLTDGAKIKMPNMKGWSLKDVNRYKALTGINIEVSGNGYVVTQNIKPDLEINKNTKIKINLE